MDDEYDDALIEALETVRPVRGYWTGGADRALAERGNAKMVLEAAGHQVGVLRSRVDGEDPPDCEGLVDGQWCGIEVTELVDRETLKASMKNLRQHPDGSGGMYLNWTKEQLVGALQDRIQRKDKVPNGGPYKRYFLIIVTDEFMLTSDVVGAYLEAAVFRAELITDVIFGLSYEPSPTPSDCPGSNPIFRLPLAAP